MWLDTHEDILGVMFPFSGGNNELPMAYTWETDPRSRALKVILKKYVAVTNTPLAEKLPAEHQPKNQRAPHNQLKLDPRTML